MMKGGSFVWARIPRAGLANKLLLLFKAMVFARLNNFPLVSTNLVSVQIGPILRREKSIRLYTGYFKKDSFFKRLLIIGYAKLSHKVVNPKVEKVRSEYKNSIFIFKDFEFWMHFFDQIREYRDWVRSYLFNDLLQPNLIKELNRTPSPHIAVHIRLGDFKKLHDQDTFRALDAWCIRTPLDYFESAIRKIRTELGYDAPVRLFTDGSEHEVKQILSIPGVELSNNKKDILDMLQMSKSKVIIPSPSSTFSLLAAYLSDAVIFHHPDFYMRPIRPKTINERRYEGPIDLSESKWSHALIEQLK